RAPRLQAEGPADLIVLSGRVWTGDPANPWAEGVAARDGAIVKVGSREDVIQLRHPRTIVIDRPGSFAMPGLIDAHAHVESLGASLEQVDLRGVSSLDEVARRVQARIESVPGDSWNGLDPRLHAPGNLVQRAHAAQIDLLEAGPERLNMRVSVDQAGHCKRSGAVDHDGPGMPQLNHV